MKPEVSLIFPVYNAEKYLAEALTCAIKQTFRNIEIICVDDGSTDRSPAILEEFANRTHGSVSCTRKSKLPESPAITV